MKALFGYGRIGHIIEIALDGIENEELRDPKICYQYIKGFIQDEQKFYLLLDEVQFMPRFEEMLNGLLRIGNIDIYVTGSNSKFLSSDVVTEFRGRGDEVRVYPLSFAEFFSCYEGDYDDAWGNICYMAVSHRQFNFRLSGKRQSI